MTIIISSTDNGAGKIGYKNLFTDAGVTVTASTEATGFEKENAYDWFGYDFWKPTATGDSWIRASFVSGKVSNYAAIWGHDLADHASSIKPQYSTNAGSTWNDCTSAVAPDDNSTIFFSWDDISAADYRILVTNPTTIAAIGGVQIGESLTFPHNMEIGFKPPSLTPIIEMKTARSESGAFIGGSQISKGIKGDFTLTNIDPAWVRSNWQPFIDHAQTPKPFVFAWDDVNHGSEVVLAWTPKDIPAPSYSNSLYMTISLMFEGTL